MEIHGEASQACMTSTPCLMKLIAEWTWPDVTEQKRNILCTRELECAWPCLAKEEMYLQCNSQVHCLVDREELRFKSNQQIVYQQAA